MTFLLEHIFHFEHEINISQQVVYLSPDNFLCHNNFRSFLGFSPKSYPCHGSVEFISPLLICLNSQININKKQYLKKVLRLAKDIGKFMIQLNIQIYANKAKGGSYET